MTGNELAKFFEANKDRTLGEVEDELLAIMAQMVTEAMASAKEEAMKELVEKLGSGSNANGGDKLH